MSRPKEVDVVIYGSGVGALAAALSLNAKSKSVLVLNPDWDFFLENSELPLDPLLTLRSAPQAQGVGKDRLVSNGPERALEELRPDFPGAVEFMSMDGGKQNSLGFKDPSAPYVRSRSRVWIKPSRNPSDSVLKKYWERLEELFVEASDADLDPKILEGVTALKKFPGFNAPYGKFDSAFQALLIPNLVDVDVDRYRYGLLEYARDKLDDLSLVLAATQVEFTDDEVRYYTGNELVSLKVKEGVLLFWTPKLTQGIRSFLKKEKKNLQVAPKGVRVWEEWVLASKEDLDAETVGVFEDMVLWADIEGDGKNVSGKNKQRLVVLREGLLLSEFESTSWASSESFQKLSLLCHEFLKWKNFSVLSLRPRATLEWVNSDIFPVHLGKYKSFVVAGADGPLMDVVRRARASIKKVTEE